MNDANKHALLSVVRTMLAAAGGWMATHKYIDADTMNEIIGAVMVVIPIAWGIWDKFRSERATKAREVVAVNVGIAVADRTVGLTPAVPSSNTQAVIEAFAPIAPVGDAYAPSLLDAAAETPTGLRISPSTKPVVQPPKEK